MPHEHRWHLVPTRDSSAKRGHLEFVCDCGMVKTVKIRKEGPPPEALR